jgi:hypothetical protein
MNKEDFEQAIAASNLFAKALFVMMEEGEGILLKSISECKDYKKDELVVVSKLNGSISIIPYDAIKTDDSKLEEGQWVKLNAN